MLGEGAGQDNAGAPVEHSLGFSGGFETRLMARMLAGLFAAGATLALVTAALPHPAGASELGLLLIVGTAYVVAGILFRYAAALPRASLPIALAWGSTLIAGVAYFSAERPSPLFVFFLWVFLYASYFFTDDETVLQVVYVGIAYSAILIGAPPPGGILKWWLVGMGTLIVAAILIRSMRERVELLISRLSSAERAARDGEARMQALLDHAPMPMSVRDLDGRFVMLNKRAAELMGDTVENLLKRPSHELYPAETIATIEAQDRPVRAGEGPTTYELATPHLDGSSHDYFVTKYPVTDADGALTGIGGISVDITERKHAERAIAHAEERFGGPLESAPDAMVIVDAGGRIVLVNAQTERLFGYGREELVGQRVELLVPDRYRERHSGHRVGFSEDPHTRSMGAELELYGRRKDGSEFAVEISLGPLETEDGTLVSSAIRDITERQRATSDVSHFKAFVASSHDAIIGKDLNGAIRSWNAGAQDIYGYSAEEVLGKSISLLVPSDQKDDLELILGQVHRGESVDTYETVRERKDGSRVEVALTVSPILASDGDVIGASTIARDITAHTRIEAELERALEKEREASERLRELDRLKDEFLSTVSHELRTPLTAIGAFAEVLTGSAETDPHMRAELLQRISGNASDMGAMIEQLLDYSRLEAGRVALEPGPLTLRAEALRCIEMARDAIGQRRSAVEVPADLEVMADQHGFERILINLLTNAAKYSPERSTIAVEARARNGNVVVSVRDEGIGIPPAEQQRVFERFYQSSLVSGKRGTGIGLSIVRRYVELQGGRTWVKSEPNRGSTFFFTLPAAAETTESML